MQAARRDDFEHEMRPFENRKVSRFMPKDPAQVLYRRLLSELDEDQLVNLESDIEHFLEGGPMSPSLSGLLTAGDRID